MANKTHEDSPTIRKQWQEWMRPWTYCSGCNRSWPEYEMDVQCECVEVEDE